MGNLYLEFRMQMIVEPILHVVCKVVVKKTGFLKAHIITPKIAL